MDIGIGLPTAVRGAHATELTDWARAAEESGFSTLSVGDRAVWPGVEPLVALALAAGVTERIRLATEVLLAARRDVALLAEQTASLHHLSHGRLVVGVAAGIRTDDYEVSGASHGDRGRRLDVLLTRLRQEWADARLGPPLPRPPQVLVGGRTEAALVRAARHADGIVTVDPPARFAARAEQAERTWREQGRNGRPRLVAHCYVALGPDAAQLAAEHLHAYYAFLGPMAQFFVDSALTSEDAVAAAVATYRRAGADEVVLVPCGARTEQLALLAAAVKDLG